MCERQRVETERDKNACFAAYSILTNMAVYKSIII